ncbi:MAG: hypothetical protein ABSH46_11235 [Bryobacteraceae bacterium]
MSVQVGGASPFFPHNSRTICGKEPRGDSFDRSAATRQRRLDVQHGCFDFRVAGLVTRLKSRRALLGQYREVRSAESMPTESLEVQAERLDHWSQLVPEDGPLVQRLPIGMEHEGIGRSLGWFERFVLLDQSSHRQIAP